MMSFGGKIKTKAVFEKNILAQVVRKDLLQGDILKIKDSRARSYSFEVLKDSSAAKKIFLECLEGPANLVGQTQQLLNVILKKGAPVVLEKTRTFPIREIELVRLRKNLVKLV